MGRSTRRKIRTVQPQTASSSAAGTSMAPQGKFTGSARVKFRFPAISSPPI